MARVLKILGVCVFLVFLGCSKENKQELARESKISTQDQPPALAQTLLDDSGRSIAKLKCQSPIGIESEHIKNRHNPEITDEIRKIVCDGYEIRIYLANFSTPAKELPLTLKVYRKLDFIQPSQYIGSNSNSVIEAYGSPLRIEGENMVYQLGAEGAEDNFAKFKVTNGIVDEITWDWVID